VCGLNGIFAYHPAAAPPEERELLDTRDAMRARGPDGCGAWWSENRRCAFGHRRLSILDLSDRASQPMLSEDGRLAVVFNGEIYNYPMLHAELEAQGTIFRTSSDTEVLLHLYARSGPEMVHRLRGMFAFAIWDSRRKGLFLARDPYGIKPLYTANDGWTFRFASQVKAFLAGGNVSRDPEPAGMIGFQLFGSVPEPFTLYREIRALAAGHTQWIDCAGPREPKLFTNLAAVLAEGHKTPSPADLPSQVRQAVFDSVKGHLLADVKVGVFLSAGVDSGALLGLLRDAGQRQVPAITLAFEEYQGTDEDESPLAALVAERYGAHHIIRRVNEREFRDDLPAILAAMDQPSIDGVNSWFVAKAAREVGLKVALSGLGADELLAGYPSFADLPRWRKRVRLLAAMPGFGRISHALLRILAPDLVRQKPKALGMFEYGSSWAGLYLLRRALFLPSELHHFMDPELVRIGLQRLKPMRILASHLKPDPGSDVGRVCALESQHYLRNQLLRDADWAGMAHGIEIRTPFVDAHLLKSLAPAIRGLVPGAGKAALAHAPSLPLPNAILRRAKTGFGVPTATWMNKASIQLTQARSPASASKGLTSRRWAQFVLGSLSTQAARFPSL
jgi:asparagine synthase (glutamine-hydrolysing)